MIDRVGNGNRKGLGHISQPIANIMEAMDYGIAINGLTEGGIDARRVAIQDLLGKGIPAEIIKIRVQHRGRILKVPRSKIDSTFDLIDEIITPKQRNLKFED